MYLSDVFSTCRRYDAPNPCNLLQDMRRYSSMANKLEHSAESDIDALEQEVPRLASEATHSAYLRALLVSEQGVLRTDDGNLVRVSPDGVKTIVARAKPRRKVKVGEVITVRKVKGKSAGEGA
jgi:hypothetical protein